MFSYRPRLPEYFESIIPQLRNLSKSDLEALVADISTSTTTETNQYPTRSVLTAFNDNGELMTIDEYCTYYGLERERVRSSKLVTHTGVPFYNIAFDDREEIEPVNWEDVTQALFQDLKIGSYKPKTSEGAKIGVVKIADLHLGAFIENLIKTKDYSVEILIERLERSAAIINSLNYAEVHVHILGDLIESFTGLNHKNSWKNMEYGIYGAKAVKTCVEILDKYFLSKIVNLKEVKIVAGNHDRVTSNNDEDVKGDAADLISWGLQLIGYSVEFHSTVLTHYVDGINHILTHGHLGISRKTTKEICWDYGKQGAFNLITEGHLHSTIQKLSVAQRNKYQTLKDTAVDHCRFNCPSFFTGNDFSEHLGFNSTAGFVIIENNGEGVPHQFNFAL